MDPVSTLLTQCVVERTSPSRLYGPARWIARFTGSRHVRFGLVRRGVVWVGCGTLPPRRLEVGDCFVVAQDAPCVMSSDPTLSVDPALDPCATEVEGVVVIDGGDTTCVEGGQIQLDDASWRLFSAVMPGVVVVPAVVADAVGLGTALRRFFAEAGSEQPGAALAAVRCGELVCLAALRQVLDDDATPRGWLAAMNDSVIGPGVRAVQSHLGGPWSVPRLAEIAGLSTSTYSARFRAVTGETPAAFLAAARMRVAAVRLLSTSDTLERMANELGYASEASFSRAFKRLHGLSPGRWRAVKRR